MFMSSKRRDSEFNPSRSKAGSANGLLPLGDAEPALVRIMTKHGEAERKAEPGGTLVFSKVGSGTSLLRAEPASIHFVLSGEEYYTIAGRTKRVRSGEFLLVAPGQELVGRNSRESLGFCMYLPGIGEPTPENGDTLGHPAVSGSGLDPLARMIGAHAAALLDGSAELTSEQFLARVENGLTGFTERLSDTSGRLSQARPATRLEVLQRLERARAYLHDHRGSAVSLSLLEREACLSRFQLVRSFVEVYGVSPVAYHRGLMLDDAARRLEEGSATPSALAQELGYASLSAFSRAFRRRFGQPPTAFIKR